MVQWSARCRRFPLRRPITRWFIRRYNVDMTEALERDPDAYPDFNGFFTRALRPEARPVVQGAGQICCPADGAMSQLGDIQGTQIFQAKGHTYSLIELLGGSEERARPFIYFHAAGHQGLQFRNRSYGEQPEYRTQPVKADLR
jgi:phosphatidylserine decarboxylase